MTRKLLLLSVFCTALFFTVGNIALTNHLVKGELSIINIVWIHSRNPLLWMVNITILMLFSSLIVIFKHSGREDEVNMGERSPFWRFHFGGLVWGLVIYGICCLTIIQYEHGMVTIPLVMVYLRSHPLFFGLVLLVPGFVSIGHLMGMYVRANEGLLEMQIKLVRQSEWTEKQLGLQENREKELKEAREDAIRGIKAKDQFLSNMSHEIRTPMNGIVGIINLLKESPLNETQQNYIEAIDQSSQNLLALINRTLDLAKANSEKLILEYVDFNLRDVIRSVEYTFQGMVAEKGLVLNTVVKKTVPERVCGDPLRLNQILLNLVGNAIKFTREGGVDVVVDCIHNDDGPRLQIQVNDTGVGIPADKLKSIFEPFIQANDDTSRLYGGTGLGLSISQKLVELYGGELKVQSQMDNGSCFEFEVQMKMSNEVMEEVSSVIQDKIAPAQPYHKARILVAEDNKAGRMVAEHTLKKLGYECDVVENGQEVINQVYEKTYDLILMDIQMPVMGGIDATRFIRNATESPLKDIKILAMTASVIDDDLHSFIKVGMNGFVPKPFKTSELSSALEEHLECLQESAA